MNFEGNNRNKNEALTWDLIDQIEGQIQSHCSRKGLYDIQKQLVGLLPDHQLWLRIL